MISITRSICITGESQSLDDLAALSSLTQFVQRSASNDLTPVFDEDLQCLAEG